MIKNLIYKSMVKIGFGTSPDFIIIGAQKAGTTGLFKTLLQHSKLNSRIKEVHYFDNDDWYAEKEVKDYHACFPLKYKVPKGGKVFEATPIYLYHPEVPKRLFEYNPKLKLIVTLRNPADRALSAWTMYHNHFKTGISSKYYDDRSFSQAINEEIKELKNLNYYNNKKGYVKRGIYHEQLNAIFNFFPKEQVLILENKEVLTMDDHTSNRIQSFIGVDQEQLRTVISNKARVNIKYKYLTELESLSRFFVPYNEKLFKLIGTRYDWNQSIKKEV